MRYQVLAATLACIVAAAPTAATAGVQLSNDLGRCDGSEIAVLALVTGIAKSAGTMRVQSYRATEDAWLEKGRWLKRIEAPARAGSMKFCMPFDEAGTYAIAIRHDVNGNGETDITKDGGGMSNNPSISIFNLGKPDHDEVAVNVDGIERLRIKMRYLW